MTLNLGQSNFVAFVMVDASAAEITGLGSGFTLELSKNGAAFVASTGAKIETGNGWYGYTATAAECNTVGVLSMRVNGAGCVQQNLEYIVASRSIGAVPYTYTVKHATGVIPGATVTVTSDLAGLIVLAQGISDALGKVVFYLQPGSYYFRVSATGYASAVDVETVP